MNLHQLQRFVSRTLFALMVIFLFTVNSSSIAKELFTYPAEFERHDSIWLAWPTYENKVGKPSEPVIMDIIRELDSFVRVDLMVQDSVELEKVKKMLSDNDVPQSHVTFRIIPHGDIWLRDMGPIFLKSNMGNLKIADFQFNTWGYENSSSTNSRLEEKVDRLVAKELGIPTIKSSLISEGGNREVNGKGTMILCEAVEKHRNPEMTRDDIEDELKRVLGQKKIIWLKKGLAEDELTFKGQLPGNVFTAITTGGHVDTFCRFVNDSTVLLAEITEKERDTDPLMAISHANMQENYDILRQATDQDGRPFTIIRMPSPPPLYESVQAGDGVFDYIQPLDYQDGTVISPDDTIKIVLPAGYLNYIVTNGIVIAQTYWKPERAMSIKEKDERVLQILGESFPGRKVVGINAESVHIGGGGIHCISQQQPGVD